MTEQKNGVWSLLAILFCGAMLLQAMFSACNSSPSTYSTPTSSTPSSDSFEHRYVQERVKREGYSDAESRQAADAIIKFHNAQQQRNR